MTNAEKNVDIQINDADDINGDNNVMDFNMEVVVEGNDHSYCKKQEVDLKSISLPPKLKKKGRPKGAELTVIGLPNNKKNKSVMQFAKLDPRSKDRIILQELTDPISAQLAIDGAKLISIENLKSFGLISDLIKNDHIDMMRVERYFTNDAWVVCLKLVEDKKLCKWVCPTCSHVVAEPNQDSAILCLRCLLWHHLHCVNMKKAPKKSNWCCKSCKIKYQ